jgi:hypothetical protein
MTANTSSAVMQQRHEPHDSLDLEPFDTIACAALAMDISIKGDK